MKKDLEKSNSSGKAVMELAVTYRWTDGKHKNSHRVVLVDYDEQIEYDEYRVRKTLDLYENSFNDINRLFLFRKKNENRR